MKPRESAFNLFIGIFALYPFCFMLTVLFPVPDWFGKDFYVSMITIALVLLLLAHLRIVLAKMSPIILVSITFLLLLIMFFRIQIYSESFATSVAARFPMMLVICFALANIFTLGLRERRIVRNVIIVEAVAQAAAGIAHHYFFPYIITSPTYGDTLFSVGTQTQWGRECGLLINANVYANFILLGVLAVMSGASKSRPVSLFEYLLVLIMGWGIVLSGSRFPTAVFFVFLAAFFIRAFSVRSFVVLAMSCAFVVVVLGSPLKGILERMVSSGRTEKNMLSLELMAQNPSHFLIGVPADIAATARTANDYGISDNSLLLTALCFGIPFLSFFISAVIFMIKRRVPLGKNAFLLALFAMLLWITNAILWDVWLLYFFGLLFALQSERSPVRVAFQT